jgi:hypothetical protein
MARLTIDRGLFWSGLLTALGLTVQLALSWSVNPLAFVAFAVVACPLVLAGATLFLWTLVAAAGSSQDAL